MFRIRLKELREERKLSQKMFAQEMEVSQSTVGNWESGIREPNFDTTAKIAQFFGVTTDYLLGKSNFRNAQALYEFWGSNSGPYFETPFDFGTLIKEEREKQGITLKEMSAALGITPKDLDDCEQGLLPLNSEWAEKMAGFLGTNVSQILFENDLYAYEVPEQYHHDVQMWEALKKREEEEAARDAEPTRPQHGLQFLPYSKGQRIPIVGSIAAGGPLHAVENIEGYDYADIPVGQDYFFLRVKGDSMTNARINNGDLVLIKQQSCAENGQIVVCLVNGEDATLKRYYIQKETVVLQPENPNYQPIIVPISEFESGYARILGVAVEVKIRL